MKLNRMHPSLLLPSVPVCALSELEMLCMLCVSMEVFTSTNLVEMDHKQTQARTASEYPMIYTRTLERCMIDISSIFLTSFCIILFQNYFVIVNDITKCDGLDLGESVSLLL
uniref:Uncharacterized protein n=1 Tax=Arion vulgaris TaxID=1028688 RepID=A0A0B7BDU2_9EUPU